MHLAVQQRGAGAPLILLHGLFGRGRNLLALQTALADTYRVIAPDLRNHGATPHAPGMDYATLAADLWETLDGLGLDRVGLVGHSMGGKVAMRAALDTPGRVTHLAVLDIAPLAYPTTLGRFAAAMQALPLSPGLTRRAADAALSPVVPDAATRAFLLQNLKTGESPGWTLGLDFIAAAMPDLMRWDARPASFTSPTLFLGGDRSDYLNADAQAAIRAQFPTAEIEFLHDAGHWLHVDQPQALLKCLRVFLAGGAE